jgi:hypothetical protein
MLKKEGRESQGGAKGEPRERTRECFPLQFPFKQRHSGIIKGEDGKSGNYSSASTT